MWSWGREEAQLPDCSGAWRGLPVAGVASHVAFLEWPGRCVAAIYKIGSGAHTCSRTRALSMMWLLISLVEAGANDWESQPAAEWPDEGAAFALRASL